MPCHGKTDLLEDSLLSDLMCEERRSCSIAVHNSEVDQIFSIGKHLLRGCLDRVSTEPTMLEQEGGVNCILRSLITEGNDAWCYLTRGSNGKWYRRTRAEPVPSEGFSGQESVPDLIINTEGYRLELKTVALFTPKDRVPEDFFSKDLSHLIGDIQLDDMELDGVVRAHRRADMCLIIGDLKILKASRRIRSMLGKEFAEEQNVRHLRDVGKDGMRFLIELQQSHGRVLCGVLAFPSKKDGEPTFA